MPSTIAAVRGAIRRFRTWNHLRDRRTGDALTLAVPGTLGRDLPVSRKRRACRSSWTRAVPAPSRCPRISVWSTTTASASAVGTVKSSGAAMVAVALPPRVVVKVAPVNEGSRSAGPVSGAGDRPA
ncbi:hypothetical protein [Sorangium cellulosum]|uniref:hypothetical protein n=1 Tax=Sorangium cellulosum TaxID=56 RepID=UPI0005D25F17|nr:hypothetical protein [Sorangium cellulosum]